MFDCLNAITKERRPKLASTQDFQGSGHMGEVSTTSAIMTSIKDFLYFRMSETMTKDPINTATIKVITDEKIARGLVSNTSLIITSKMGESSGFTNMR